MVALDDLLGLGRLRRLRGDGLALAALLARGLRGLGLLAEERGVLLLLLGLLERLLDEGRAAGALRRAQVVPVLEKPL